MVQFSEKAENAGMLCSKEPCQMVRTTTKFPGKKKEKREKNLYQKRGSTQRMQTSPKAANSLGSIYFKGNNIVFCI